MHRARLAPNTDNRPRFAFAIAAFLVATAIAAWFFPRGVSPTTFRRSGLPTSVTAARRAAGSDTGRWQALPGPVAGAGSFLEWLGGHQYVPGSFVVAGGGEQRVLYTISANQLFRIIPARSEGLEVGAFGGSLIHEVQVAGTPEDHRLYVRTNSGLFSSDDRGEHWKSVGPPSRDPLLRAFSIDRIRGEMVVACTRSQLFVSTNAGKTWKEMPPLASYAPFDDVEIISDAGTVMLFVACERGLVRVSWPDARPELVKQFSGSHVFKLFRDKSTGAIKGAVFVAQHGWIQNSLWRSRDLGATWEQVGPPIRSTFRWDSAGLWTFPYDPWERVELWDKQAASWLVLQPLGDGGLLVSRDDGGTWRHVTLSGTQLIPADLGGVSDGMQTKVYALSSSGGLLELDLSSETWTETLLDLPTASVRTIVVTPTVDEESLLLAAVGAQIFESPDSGSTWRPLGNVGDKNINVLLASPDYIRDAAVLVGTADGLYSVDVKDGTPKKNEALGTVSVTAILFSPRYSTDSTTLVGTDDGLYRSTTSGNKWARPADALRGIPVNDLLVSGSSYFAATRHGVYQSLDGGDHWSRILESGTSGNVLTLESMQGRNNLSWLFAGTASGALRSGDGGRSWQRLELPSDSRSVSSIAADDDGETIYVGTIGGGVLVSRDGGGSWTRMPSEETALAISDLQVVKKNPRVLFAATLGRGVWHYQEPALRSER